jgi:hypothetical protein
VTIHELIVTILLHVERQDLAGEAGGFEAVVARTASILDVPQRFAASGRREGVGTISGNSPVIESGL